jgi:RNA polymerase sigma-70 factor, ECF subfamily
MEEASTARRVGSPDPVAGERSLMERMQADDPSALDEVLRRYWTRLVAYARRMAPEQDSAEDLVQEALVRVWKGRAEWNPSERLGAFLYRVTRNLALDARRRREVRDRFADGVREEDRHAGPSPLEEMEASDLSRAASAAIEALSPRRREVFVLSRYHGYSYREIAGIMGISPQTVANQMSTALDELRQSLRPFLPEGVSAPSPEAGRPLTDPPPLLARSDSPPPPPPPPSHPQPQGLPTAR